MAARILLASIFCAAFAGVVSGAAGSLKLAHRVVNLPNLNTTIPLKFSHYAGYIELATLEKLFYWYAEAQEDSEHAPVVLWLNGGPGCSSLGGMFTENGPFVVQQDLSVELNSYSWNRKVNMLWVEAPAGVGFSGPHQKKSYYTDDNVAERTYEFLSLFFSEYEELKGRPFYITGESYAGIYIPYLVNILVTKPIPSINLVGFGIGNPFTDSFIDGNAYMEYLYSHGLISYENYHDIQVFCGDEAGLCMYTPLNCSTNCVDVLKQALDESDMDELDPYYIYGDKCLMNNSEAQVFRRTKLKRRDPLHRGNIYPCTDTFTQIYLRSEEVKKAIHVTERYDPWSTCSDFVGDAYISSDTSLPKYHSILGKGEVRLKVLIYSGDADAVVNFLGTERWISRDGLKLHINRNWRPWFGPDRQLAGYVQDYDGLTFKTIKGAGHMVPAVRPLWGCYMFECFVFGEETCASFQYPHDFREEESGAYSSATYKQISTVQTWSPIFIICAAVCFLVAFAVKNLNKRAHYSPIRETEVAV